MHMLRDEDNEKYRMAIKNTLEFDPQILKRYVNFMNNPDENTAIEQFGNGDKYFGVATVLATLPGLPMFGHGQVEGLREKYGMEFRKPKWDETPDEGLIAGHAWKIFPVLHRRYLFADVENFFLYDLYRSDGGVDENVFAYSNMHNDERGVVIYHNRFADTRGWIKTSAAFLDKNKGDLRQKSLAEGLRLPTDGYVVFKDYVTHLEYIRSCVELREKGLYLELHAYQHHVFMDWRFVDGKQWRDIYVALNGAGVDSMQAQFEEMFGSREEVPQSGMAPKALIIREKEKAVRKPAQRRKKKEEMQVKSARKKTPSKAGSEKKASAKKTTASKKSSTRASAVATKSSAKKPKVTMKKSTTAKKPSAKTSSPKRKPAKKKAVVRKPSKGK
jgi:hypothetical protein